MFPPTLTPPTQVRSSPGVIAKRSLTPYANFYTTTLPPSQPKSSNYLLTWKFVSPDGHGSRHVKDDFNFDLWDSKLKEFRLPSRAEKEEILKKYEGQAIRYQWPFVIVSTLNPPQGMTLTIGGATACFVSPDTFQAR